MGRTPPVPDFDGVRTQYMRRLRDLTGRGVIVYASGWLQGASDSPSFAVRPDDVHALMETCRGMPDEDLDLILHTPGGSLEAAEQMLNYLRSQFRSVRAIVPLQAKSAGTILALGCDEIVMGLHSELGPIDPQLLIPVPEGRRFAPAHAIVRDFERAKEDVKADPARLAAWTPILRSYAGGLLDVCEQQVRLSRDVVAGWLERYMLAHDDAGVPEDKRKAVAEEIADYFGSAQSYDRFRTHGRPIRVEELERVRGLRMRRLEADDELQDAVLTIYHGLDVSFSASPAVKYVENHLGARKVSLEHSVMIQAGPAPGESGGPPGEMGPPRPGLPRPGLPQPGLSRAERRRRERSK